jgi:hypothetical protein
VLEEKESKPRPEAFHRADTLTEVLCKEVLAGMTFALSKREFDLADCIAVSVLSQD